MTSTMGRRKTSTSVQKGGQEVAAAPEECISLSALLDRGWTRAMVTRLLGEPDTRKPNPRYRSAAPMRLYALERVERCESGTEFQELTKRAVTRSSASRQAAARSAAALIAQARTLEVQVDRIPLTQAQSRAIASYNSWTDGDPASTGSDRAFLDRITVNYIRHEATRYDASLEEVAGRTGVNQAVSVIRGVVYAAIAAAYPELAGECVSQASRRGATLDFNFKA
jgi:hypothetical protein